MSEELGEGKRLSQADTSGKHFQAEGTVWTKALRPESAWNVLEMATTGIWGDQRGVSEGQDMEVRERGCRSWTAFGGSLKGLWLLPSGKGRSVPGSWKNCACALCTLRCPLLGRISVTWPAFGDLLARGSMPREFCAGKDRKESVWNS